VTDIFARFSNPDTGSAVIFEDNGRVAYAYWLAAGGGITGDVWLYNRCEAPPEPEWVDRSKAPFANPRSYAKTDAGFELPRQASDVEVAWLAEGTRAAILIGGRVVALLEAGARPGWSVATQKDGPLALVLPG
jgi:hypothetical protein